jgi:hypothetical protein
VLAALIDEALRANPSVRTAGLRILEARAQLGIATSTRYPQVQQLTGEVLRIGERQSPGPDTFLTASSVGLAVGWELDFWGKFRRGVEAADASYFASIAQYDDLQVLMAAQVASFYCAIRTLELRLVITQENAALQRRSLEIIERLFKSGNDTELDVQQAKAQYLATLPQLEASLRQTQNALSVLLARPPVPCRRWPGPRWACPRGNWKSSPTSRPSSCAAVRTCGRRRCSWRPSPPSSGSTRRNSIPPSRCWAPWACPPPPCPRRPGSSPWPSGPA